MTVFKFFTHGILLIRVTGVHVHTVQNQGMRLNLTSMPRGQHDRIRFDLDKNMCSIVNQLRLLYTSEHYAILKIAMY